MKKICFLTINGFTPWGGSDELWHQTAISLHAKNFLIYVICMDWKSHESEKIKELEKMGIIIMRVPFLNSIYNKARRVLSPILGDRKSIFINKAIEKIKPDLVVHTNMAPRGSDDLEAVINFNIPYVIDVQLADELLWHNCTEEMINCYLNAKAIFFLCERNKICTEKQLGAKLSNAKKSYNPIKTTGDVDPLKINDNVINFACVGRMGVEHKRQDLILEALSNPVWNERNWNLHFYGKGEHENSLKRLVKMYSLQEKVFFNGHVNDIDDVWKKCHALLLPSTYESVPMAVTEAMKCGRVVIVTNVGVSSDYVIDGVNGFKSPSATLSEYSAALERAWENKLHWNRIGNEAKETIFSNFPEKRS